MKRCLGAVLAGALILALLAYLYVYIAFPDDVAEDVIQEFAHKDRKVNLCKRYGGATVGCYYVVYDGEVKPDNVAVLLKDSGFTPNISWDATGCVIVSIERKNGVVYCRDGVHTEETNDGGVVVRIEKHGETQK